MLKQVTSNDIKKEIKSLDSSKRVHLKILVQNLSIKGKIYFCYYEIYGLNKMYTRGLFQRITPVFLKKTILFSLKTTDL